MSFKNESYMEVLYFAHGGSGDSSGKSADNAAPIASAQGASSLLALPAGMVVEEADVVIDVAVTGSTDVDVGDVADPDGYVDGSVDLTLGTPALYVGAGALVAAAAKDYNSAATTLEVAVTGASTAGSFRVVLKGYRLRS